MDKVLNLLPQNIRTELQKKTKQTMDKVEEIRLRVDRFPELIVDGKPLYLDQTGPFTLRDAQALIGRLSDFSLYTLEEELKRGYVTIQGGHRVGLAGKVVTEGGEVKLIRDISSFNIRIARQKIGAARSVVSQIYKNQRWQNTLFIGPPQTGKTTLLRDLARIASLGEGGIPPIKVGIVDERSEIAGCIKGVPQNQFGQRIDILDACPKAEGMMMLIRSMSPDLIIVDEIGRKEDTDALLEALNAGVSVVASAHGWHFDQLLKRPNVKPLIDHRVFDRFVLLSRKNHPGVISSVLDSEGHPLRFGKGRALG